MASSPKHTTSSTSARRLKYGGNSGKGELLDAINFLFQIKGHEYKKKHKENRDFLVPSAEEFLTYASKVNEEFKKMKKHSPTRKDFAFAIKPVRTIAVTKHGVSQPIDDFLLFIAPWAHSNHPSHHLLQCFTIVFYALLIYNYTKETLYLHAENPKASTADLFHTISHTCASPSHFSEPFHWFIYNITPTFIENSEQLFTILYTYVSEKIIPVASKQLSTFKFPSENISFSLGSALASIINTLMMIPQSLDYSVTLPVFCYLVRNGYEDCKSICNEALLRCKIGAVEDAI